MAPIELPTGLTTPQRVTSITIRTLRAVQRARAGRWTAG